MVLPIIGGIAAGVLGAIGSRSAGRSQERAAQKAADAQLTATRETNDMLRDFRREDIARFDPFYQAGTNALGQYVQGVNTPFRFNMEMDPGYQFRRNEGMEGVQSTVAARQGLASGAALEEAARFNQNFASNEFGNAFNRQYGMFNDRLNRLGQLASSGQNAAGMQGAASANFGQQMGQNMMQAGQSNAQGFANAGNARAAGTVGAFNALGSGLSQGLGMWQQNQMMNAFMPQNAGANPFRIGAPMGGR